MITYVTCGMEAINNSANISFIMRELEWLKEVMNTRLKLYFKNDTAHVSIEEIKPQNAIGLTGTYDVFVAEHKLTVADRIALMLPFVPMLKPQLFDAFCIRNSDTGRQFVEFGGIYGSHYTGFIPTLETLLFILAGNHTEQRLMYYNYFERHFLFQRKVIIREQQSVNDPPTAAMLIPSQHLTSQLISEKAFTPEFSPRFPARRLITNRKWEDLILEESVLEQIREIRLWTEYGNRMLDQWELRDRMKPGFKALFYGPSGTGKTLTASLLGKYTGKEVYCIDLSMVVSKYIGETEKNLAGIFEMAEDKNWILFFDEGDALFGKRTQIKDAHDRYANQEVSYLLQRVEDYPGLVVLSTNLKGNIDEAFVRRFQSMIRFLMPDPEQRERLWRETFSHKTTLEPSIDLKEIAKRYELSGGSILNVVRYCSLMAMQKKSNVIIEKDLIEGIRKEFRKEGKIMD